MEVPGLKMDDVTIYRQNVKTIIKGNKLKPYVETEQAVVEKQERNYGEF